MIYNINAFDLDSLLRKTNTTESIEMPQYRKLPDLLCYPDKSKKRVIALEHIGFISGNILYLCFNFEKKFLQKNYNDLTIVINDNNLFFYK